MFTAVHESPMIPDFRLNSVRAGRCFTVQPHIPRADDLAEDRLPLPLVVREDALGEKLTGEKLYVIMFYELDYHAFFSITYT